MTRKIWWFASGSHKSNFDRENDLNEASFLGWVVDRLKVADYVRCRLYVADLFKE